MADDGMLMNFSIGDGPLITKQHFQGGRWRDRLAAKKVAKSRNTKRANPNPSSRELFQEKRHEIVQEDYIGPSPKRQRVEQKEGNANRTPVGVRESVPKKAPESIERAERAPPKTRAILENDETRAKYISGKLPPGSIGGSGLGAKKKFGDEEVEKVIPAPAKTRALLENDETRPQYMSGKLPPGSIGGGGLGVKKKFDDDFDHVRPTTRPATVSRKLSPESNTVGNRVNLGHKASFIPGKQNPGNTGPGVDSKGKPGQIISSLFSFNPSSKTTFEELEEESEPVKPSNAPLAEEMETFTALGLSRRLAAHLSTKMEMKAPTAIQKAAIPEMIKEDSDAFIQAETGSGKTLAYLLPIVERILALSEAGAQVHRDSGLFAVVLAPTRELCKQIATVLEKILRCAPWIVGTTVIGGESKNSEKARLRKGVNILIATPGRLADHLDNTEVLNVSTVRWLVLDEGDRLMELGFEEEIRGIVEKISKRALTSSHKTGLDLKALPSRRITVLCSATMKMNVQRLGEISLKDAVHIQADPSEKEANEVDGEEQKKFSAPAQLKQAYAVVPAKLRLVTLTAILKRAFARRGSVMKAIVFISCADSVDFHFSLFSRTLEAAEGEDAVQAPVIDKTELTKDTISHATTISSKDNSVVLAKLHGSLAQNIRTATLKAFTESTEPCVLICTDVASRGLDLPNVDYVIEYDPPFSADDHLHRVGRTARAGKDGRALIFLMPGEEEEYVSTLASGYREGRKALTHNTADDLLRKGFGGTGKEWEDRATEYQLEVERWTQESPKYLEMARRGFQSHIRAYATHVANERHMFNMQTLHLGHLAKAFALRDKPGSIKVPGLRPQKMTKADRSVAARKAKRGEVEEKVEGERERKLRKVERDAPVVDGGDAVRRMKKKMKEHMAVASEFNIG